MAPLKPSRGGDDSHPPRRRQPAGENQDSNNVRAWRPVAGTFPEARGFLLERLDLGFPPGNARRGIDNGGRFVRQQIDRICQVEQAILQPGKSRFHLRLNIE